MPNRCFEIPYLSSAQSDQPPYDNGDFATYIDRRPGWSADDIVNSKQSGHSQIELAEIVQTWLFFGLIEKAFKNRAQQLDFVDVSETGKPLVTTAALWRLCYEEFLTSTDEQKNSDIRKDLQKSIELAAEVVGRIHLDLEEIDKLLESVLYSVMILCDALQLSLNPATAILPSRQWPMSDTLVETHMLQAGWCPSDVQRLTKMLDLHSLTLASRLPPRDHGGHGKCDDIRCYANDVVKGQYERPHYNCDGCEEFVADPVEIFEILEQGHLPLIDPNQTQSPKLLLQSTFKVPKYVAISHVWSDGLGNPERNAIYKCQLDRLQSLVARSSSPALPIWLDAISCPREYKHMRERSNKAYDQAISFMRRTYQDADFVLVLDHSLFDLSVKTLTNLGILLRLISCGWTRRLWTYQEGVLAKRLVVQFADGAVDIDEIYSKWQGSGKSVFYPGIRGGYKELRILLDASEEDYVEKVLHRVSRPLEFRKTSVASDEALCLSTLANLPPDLLKKVSASEKESRMEVFYASLPIICKQLIFWHGNRLDKMGFRWAPASFLNNSNLYLRDWDHGPSADSNKAVLSSSGLSFECPGILLGKLTANLQSFLMTTGLDNWYHVTCRQFDGSEGLPFRIVPGDGMPDISLAILNPTPFSEDFAGPGFEARLSLIVAVVAREKDNTLVAQVLCPAFVLRRRQMDTEFPLVMRTYSFFKQVLQGPETKSPEIDLENASLLDDFALIDQYKTRGHHAVLEHIQGAGSAGENNLWAGTSISEGRISLVREGMHTLFEGTELPPIQKWCLD